MRILITGANGFVAPYVSNALKPHLKASDDVILTGRASDTTPDDLVSLDVTDAAAIDSAMSSIVPTHVIHLAAISSVGGAGSDPDLAWRVNVGGTLAIARAILRSAPGCTLIFASSGQVYGETAHLDRALSERDVLAPVGEYAATKAAADLALGSMVGRGLRCVRLRPFNHTGAGQTEDFVLPAFAGQIARIEAGSSPPVMKVGNLDAERDFLDVRDVADVYARVVLQAQDMRPGAILNIASGVPSSIGGLLDRLLAMSSATIRIEQDPDRMRPSDTPRYVGDATLARELLDWKPRRSMDDMLSDVLNAARARARHPSSPN